ncbi:MAG TPA: M14 family zinc carboxypeptidase, partial [Chloroflexia bacterium]|nr:M14 family zinc carboxypeptidase [Chloroflexia bacterium]
MNTKYRSFSRSIMAKLIVPAFMLLLPLLTVGGTPGANTAIASAPLPASSVNSDGAADKYPLLVMRVYFDSLAQRDALARELSPEEKSTTGGYLTVIRDRNLYENLKARGLRVEIDEAQSATVSGIGTQPDTFFSGYKTVEEIYAFIDQKVAQYPNLVEKVDYGDSWCKTHPGSCTLPDASNGYDMIAMHITNQAISGPKPVFWAEAGIHAREIATPEVMMRLTNWLLDGYNTNADAHWMVDYEDIWITLTVNPDGHHIVESGGNSPYYQRKNGDNVGGSGCAWPPTPYDHSGVDNNRNFPFKWNCCGGSSSDPCEQTYHGVSSGSEDENQAIVTLVRSLIPDQRGPGDTDAAPITTTGIFQDLHSDSEQNLYTWGWTNNNMPNYAETRNIAAHMSAVNAGGNGYYYGSIYGGLYPVDGGSIDWSYGELGIASVSTEVGGNDFLPAYSCLDNPGCGSTRGIWPDNKNQLIFTGKIASTPYLTIHGPDTHLDSSTPITVTQGATPILTSTVTFAWTGNVFSQNVGAAEYYMDTPPMAGGTGVAMQPTDGTFNSPTEGVQATIDTGSLSVGRHIVFMRGRGANDFSGYQTWGAFSAVFLDVTSNGGATPTPTNTPTITPTVPTNTPTNTRTNTP